jgi:N6-adenosine-specific RNA methylase IME4
MTVPGQAYFAGTGPSGALCGDCESWRGSCLRYARMMPSAGEIAVPPKTPACNYWKHAPDNRVVRNFRLAEDDPHFMALIEKGGIHAELTALAKTGFKAACLLSDNPWKFRTRSEKGEGRSARRHYPTMTVEELVGLGPLIRAVTLPDSVLILWIIMPLLMRAPEVITAWGYTYKTCGFTWAKINRDGSPWKGTGYWTRANAELALLCTQGRPKRLAKDVGQLILARRGAHSAKPPEIHDRLVRLLPGPFLELFAREPRLGWRTLGTMEGTA